MSKLDQINQTRWKSFTFDARVDVRSMATIVLFFNKNNIPVVSRASAGRLAIEYFCEIILQQNPELEITDPHEALETLQTCGISPAPRSNKPLMKHLASASLSMDTGPNPEAIIKQKTIAKPIFDDNSQLVRAVQAKMQKNDEEIIAAEKSAFTERIETEEEANENIQT